MISFSLNISTYSIDFSSLKYYYYMYIPLSASYPWKQKCDIPTLKMVNFNDLTYLGRSTDPDCFNEIVPSIPDLSFAEIQITWLK